MKKMLLLTMIISVFTITSFASDDYFFSISEPFVNKYIDFFEEEFNESSLSKFNFEFAGNNEGKITCRYLIVPVRIDFTLEQAEVNQIDFFIERFRVLGFIPLSKKMLARKIMESLDEVPAMKEVVNIAVRNGRDDETFGITVRFQKSPVELLSELTVDNANLNRERMSIFGNVFEDTSHYTTSNTADNDNNSSSNSIMYVDVSAANLRTGPDTGFEKINTITRDTKVQILARLEDWYKIRVVDTGFEGYIYGELLRQ
ncbi:MAG: SH3 domain-containing protein [Candidatus Muiribacteriota bacterium]